MSPLNVSRSREMCHSGYYVMYNYEWDIVKYSGERIICYPYFYFFYHVPGEMVRCVCKCGANGRTFYSIEYTATCNHFFSSPVSLYFFFFLSSYLSLAIRWSNRIGSKLARDLCRDQVCAPQIDIAREWTILMRKDKNLRKQLRYVKVPTFVMWIKKFPYSAVTCDIQLVDSCT